MKTTRTILLLLFPCFFLSMKCQRETEDCHYSVWFNNQTDQNLYVVYSFDYPDTSITFQNPAMRADSYVPANKRTAFFKANGCVENYMKIYSKTDTLSIFVFDVALIQSTSWSQVRQNYQVLKRYDYSLDELRNTNFSIDFP